MVRKILLFLSILTNLAMGDSDIIGRRWIPELTPIIEVYDKTEVDPFFTSVSVASRQKRTPLVGFHQQTGLITGDDLLSQDLSSHYHRRTRVSLPGSEWDRVVPLCYGHQKPTFAIVHYQIVDKLEY